MAVHLGLLLVAASGLLLEIGLVRSSSVEIWYRLAFAAISVALLGVGLGGFVLHLLRDRLRLTLEKAAAVTFDYSPSIAARR